MPANTRRRPVRLEKLLHLGRAEIDLRLVLETTNLNIRSGVLGHDSVDLFHAAPWSEPRVNTVQVFTRNHGPQALHLGGGIIVTRGLVEDKTLGEILHLHLGGLCGLTSPLIRLLQNLQGLDHLLGGKLDLLLDLSIRISLAVLDIELEDSPIGLRGRGRVDDRLHPGIRRGEGLAVGLGRAQQTQGHEPHGEEEHDSNKRQRLFEVMLHLQSPYEWRFSRLVVICSFHTGVGIPLWKLQTLKCTLYLGVFLPHLQDTLL